MYDLHRYIFRYDKLYKDFKPRILRQHEKWQMLLNIFITFIFIHFGISCLFYNIFTILIFKTFEEY